MHVDNDKNKTTWLCRQVRAPVNAAVCLQGSTSRCSSGDRRLLRDRSCNLKLKSDLMYEMEHFSPCRRGESYLNAASGFTTNLAVQMRDSFLFLNKGFFIKWHIIIVKFIYILFQIRVSFPRTESNTTF